MILIKNTQRKIKINTKALKANVSKMLSSLGYEDYDISIWFTTNATIRKYNKKYRKKDKATDILSFPYHDIKPGEKIKPLEPEDKNLGDIIISLEYVQANLDQWNTTLNKRINALLAHGLAHLLGYDHNTEKEHATMSKMEAKLIKAL